jgi:hypothetical protein
MRFSTVLIAGALALGTAGASASPLVSGGAAAVTLDPLATTVHHKPGHRGGPPWTRQQPSRTERYVERPAYRTSYCRTTYRTQYDPDLDEYVRRAVRVCS